MGQIENLKRIAEKLKHIINQKDATELTFKGGYVMGDFPDGSYGGDHKENILAAMDLLYERTLKLIVEKEQEFDQL